MTGEPMAALGGRKFALAILAIAAIVGCAVMKADPASFTAIASVAIAFAAGNAYVTGRYAETAAKPDAVPRAPHAVDTL